MSIDFERGLRDEMEQAPIRPRPGLVREAYRRSRRRQLAVRATLAAGTAVVASVAATIAVTGLPGQQRIETTAYVVSQVNSALATADHDIMHVSQGGVAYMDARGSALTEQYWSYGNQSRETMTFSGSREDNWDTVTPVRQGTEDVEVGVSYSQRTVTKQTTIIPTKTVLNPATCSGAPGSLVAFPGTGAIENASWVAGWVHAVLGCGAATATSNQRYEGTEAIKLSGRLSDGTWWLWVDQSTFLPIASGFSSTAKDGGSGSDSYQWLPPTKANLASLTGQIPAGFKVITEKPHTIVIPTPPRAASTVPVTPTSWGTGPAATIARRMTDSLTATSSEIAVVHQGLNGSRGPQLFLSWIYQNDIRSQTYEAGKLTTEDFQTVTRIADGKEQDLAVQITYTDRQVSRQKSVEPYTKPWGNGLPTPVRVCAIARDPTDADPLQNWSGWGQAGEGITEAVVVRDLLTCPGTKVTITSGQRFSGAEAIKITWARPGTHATDTIWLSQSTYALMGLSVGTDPGHRAYLTLQMSWLPPTKANLAQLAISIPPGYTTVMAPSVDIGTFMFGSN